MTRYDSYKDSGVDWIREIPIQWSKMRGKFLFLKKKELNGQFQESNLLSLTMNGVLRKDMNSFEGLRPSDYSTYQIFNENDLVFKMIDLENEKTSRVGWVHERGIMSPVYLRIEPRKRMVSRFGYYYFYDLYNQRVFNFLGSGVRSSLTVSDLLEIDIPLPPFKEQEQIVEYLDRKTTLIDSLIEKTVRKIELLKEKRTSLINEVVTKGLNLDVEMKDSGVEWIGEIPSHWEGSKLGFYTTKIGSGSTPRGGAEVYVESGVPFIRSQNVHFEGLKLMEVSFIDFETHQSMKGSVVREEDVLLNITGGSIGRCCVVDVEAEMNVNQHVSIIRTKSQLLNRFLNFLITCDVGQSQVRFNLSGGNREGLTIEGIRDFQITLPPLHEQEQIVEYLDEQTSIIDSTITAEEKRIDLLKEYRQSLISEVVTGKVKVA